MPTESLRQLLVAASIACLLSAPMAGAQEVLPAVGESREVVLTTPWFRFHSDFDFNLMDALLTAATARLREQPDPLLGDCFSGLVNEERSAWNAAVGYYAETVAATRDFSRERLIVRARLAGFTLDLDDDDVRDLDLSLLFLRAAARAYRSCAWSARDATNRAWIAGLAPRLERHADTIGHRLEELFGVEWRSLPVEVDVVGTSGWSGADTVAIRPRPTHTQISSSNDGYRGAAALEMIFHEASHELVSPRNGPIAALLAEEAAGAGGELDPNLWHALLFVTVGEVTREVLDAAGEGPYQPYAEANGVFGGHWAPLYPPLVEFWLPFVRGEVARQTAVRALVRAAVPKTASP